MLQRVVNKAMVHGLFHTLAMPFVNCCGHIDFDLKLIQLAGGPHVDQLRSAALCAYGAQLRHFDLSHRDLTLFRLSLTLY